MGTKYRADLRQKLTFRRQFLISSKIHSPNRYWSTYKLSHGLTLSIHNDLSFHSKEIYDQRITLIGIAVDCKRPYKSDSEITANLLNNFEDIYSVIDASKPLAGRWILVCQDAKNTFIFNDACGLRQVYFHCGTSLSCASQPTLLKQALNLSETENESILNLKNSKSFVDKESAWVGNKTLYENCYKLMPNHYLDLNKGKQVRFFPKHPISVSDDTEKLADTASKYLVNILIGLADEYNIKINLTAGFDSRLLLAASKRITEKVTFSTDKLGWWKEYHADIYIPQLLADKFDLNYELINSNKKPSNWFYEILTENISLARTSSAVNKTKSIYRALTEGDNHIQINGNVTEIVRIHESDLKYESSSDVDTLLNYYSYDNSYIHKEIITWFKGIDERKLKGISVYNLFYWEQRMGNWGALYPAELDIATETISPFNCRSLLEICLKVPLEQRKAPDFLFFRMMIEKLWPDLLSVPINPGPKGWGLVKKRVRESLPSHLVHVIQKIRAHYKLKSATK